MKKTISILLCLLLAFALVAGCAKDPAKTDESKKTETAGDTSASKESGSEAPALDGKIVFGVTAALTGENKMVGDYVKNGAELAKKHINENGGILGKELELVYEDEVNNQQASVNAMTKLMARDDMIAFFGSTYSSYCIAASPVVKEKEIIMFAGGSSANIPKENNPWIWQVRMTDDQSGMLLAKAATENLNMKNPAILFSTESFGNGLKEQTVDALKKLGVEVPENQMIGFSQDEKNFSPLISNIQNSSADGLIAIAHQLPSAMICQQVSAVGLEVPLLGSSSWASAVCRENAGADSNGWYAVADWTVEVTTDEGKKFAKDYLDTYGADSDMPAVCVYDSIMVFKKACEIANSTTDRAAINKALEEIKDFPGAMSTYTYSPNRCFSSSQFLTLNKDLKATMVDIVKKGD